MTSDFIKVGLLNGAFGTSGSCRIYSYTDPRSSILCHEVWWVYEHDAYRPLAVENAQLHKGGRSIIAKLEGIDSPEDALKNKNKTLWIPSHALPKLPEDEHYWHELIGMAVINTDNQPLGLVQDIIETGANDVLIVYNDNDTQKRYLIPFKRPEIILSIADNIITTKWSVDWDTAAL